jgi:hypothetical protein
MSYGTKPLTDAERKREPGFYWAKYIGDLEVMQWERETLSSGVITGWWTSSGSEQPFNDDEIEEIDERQIVRDEWRPIDSAPTDGRDHHSGVWSAHDWRANNLLRKRQLVHDRGRARTR